MTQLGVGSLGSVFRSANVATVSFDPNARVEFQWFIDPVNGADNNNGNTPTAPLKTHGELVRRLGDGLQASVTGADTVVGGSVYSVTTIYLLGDLPESDQIDLEVVLRHAGIWIYQGTRSVLRSSAFTAVTAQNRATNTPWSVTDGALDWTPFVGKRIRVTSGVNFNQTAWVAKNLGAGAARISSPANPNYPPPSTNLAFASTNPGVFSNGDPYVIEQLSKAYIRHMEIEGDFSSGAIGTLAFVDLDLRGVVDPFLTAPNALSPQGGSFVNFVACEFSTARAYTLPMSGILTSFVNCGFMKGVLSRGRTVFDAGLALGASSFRLFGPSAMDGDFMMHGTPLQVLGTLLVAANVCAFDSSGAGIVVGEDFFGTSLSTLNIIDVLHGGHDVWGSGNVGPGIRIGVGVRITYATSVPTITGASDYVLAGAATGRAWDEGAGVYTAPIANTWANLALPIGGGGFGGSAHNVQSDAHVLGGAI